MIRRVVVRGNITHFRVHHTLVKPLVWWISCQGKRGGEVKGGEGRRGEGRGGEPLCIAIAYNLNRDYICTYMHAYMCACTYVCTHKHSTITIYMQYS